MHACRSTLEDPTFGALRRERAPDGRPALTVLALGVLLFAGMHYHGYYLVAWLPAAAVLAAIPLAGRPRLLAALVTLNALAALVVLGGHKLGRAEVALAARAAPRAATWLLPPPVWEGYWTLVELYAEPSRIAAAGCATAGERPVVLLPARAASEPAAVVRDGPRLLVLAGWGVGEMPANPHHLAWGPLVVARRPGVLAGFAPLDDPPALGIERLPAGTTACLPGP